MQHYDYVIVGGGSAGCVLARRLSASAQTRVLLIEAGPDLTDETMPADIAASYPGTAYANPARNWPGLEVRSTGRGGHNEPDGPEGGVRRAYVQARILGGGSSINGQMANWGVPGDYDEWADLGAEGWDWEGVFPYFRRIETDRDFPGPGHGSDGPIGIRRIFPPEWNGHAKALGATLERLGYAYLPDQNGDFGDGYFPLAHANIDERRVTAATTYLDPATRARANLTVMCEAQVTGLSFEGARCTGVQVETPGGKQTIAANEVILSAGAIHSPAMLLRAGIGAPADLRAMGIAPRVPLIGVGRNLMDHPQVAVGAWLSPAARMDGSTGRHVLIGMRYTSSGEGVPQGDMFLGCVSRTAWHAVGRQLGALTVWVNKTYSRDGAVELAGPDWRQEPKVDFRLLSDRRDMDRLKEGVRLIAHIYAQPEMTAVAHHPFPASYTDKARQVGAETLRNRVITDVLAGVLDAPGPLRRLLIDKVVRGGPSLGDCLNDDSALEGFIRETVSGIWHASCSCRMGRGDDPLAVTDNQGRVHGVGGLRVCDASLFPSVPSANTNIPTFMVAEKIAAAINGEAPP